MSRQIKDALLERYLAGDVTPEQRKSLDATLSASEDDRARLDELQKDTSAFLVAHPPGPLVAKVAERQRKRFFLRLMIPAVAVAGCVALLAFAAHQVPIDQKKIELAVFAAQADGIARPLAVATPGDAVKFLLAGRAMGYVAVMGRDAQGHVRVYVPKEGQTAERYDPKKPLLPGVSNLSPQEGREEIIGLFCPREFELAPVVEALRDRQPLTGLLPEGSVTAIVPLEKTQADGKPAAAE
ncbi:MAG: hypothetical protein QM765_03490 [Myxococcales bacterium]